MDLSASVVVMILIPTVSASSRKCAFLCLTCFACPFYFYFYFGLRTLGFFILFLEFLDRGCAPGCERS